MPPWHLRVLHGDYSVPPDARGRIVSSSLVGVPRPIQTIKILTHFVVGHVPFLCTLCGESIAFGSIKADMDLSPS